MVENGNDEYKEHQDSSDCNRKWGPKSGSAGSPFWTTKGRVENNYYSEAIPVFEFPSVPYFSSHFHCHQEINDWTNTDQLDKCSVGNLIDLNTDDTYVQQRIADFFTELLSIGISGFSINNGKHISPLNLAQIFGKLKSNLGEGDFPDDFIAYLEINLGKEYNILICNNNGDYNFGSPFETYLSNQNLSGNDITKIKILIEDKDFQNSYCDNNEWVIPQDRHIIFLENQNKQKINDGGIYMKDKDKVSHKNNYISMLNNNNYNIKIIFSSYILKNGACGFPDGHSDCDLTNDNSCTKSIPYVKAYSPLSIGYDDYIEGNYTRIHRDIDIVNSMRLWLNIGRLTEDELYGEERRKAQYFYNPTTIPSTLPDTTEPTMESSIPYTSSISMEATIYETTETEVSSFISPSSISNDCEEKCLTCNEESKELNLCLSCNKNKDYYPVNYNKGPQIFFECFQKKSPDTIILFIY